MNNTLGTRNILKAFHDFGKCTRHIGNKLKTSDAWQDMWSLKKIDMEKIISKFNVLVAPLEGMKMIEQKKEEERKNFNISYSIFLSCHLRIKEACVKCKRVQKWPKTIDWCIEAVQGGNNEAIFTWMLGKALNWFLHHQAPITDEPSVEAKWRGREKRQHKPPLPLGIFTKCLDVIKNLNWTLTRRLGGRRVNIHERCFTV